MKRALVTGVTGQDGQYLGRFLLAKGYEVIGLTRDTNKAMRRFVKSPRFYTSVYTWDFGDRQQFLDVLQRCQPTEVYNLAGFSTGTGMFNDPVSMGRVNGLAVAEMLDCIYQSGLAIRFLQASSREVFGDAAEAPQNEDTLRKPRNPYGAAKQYADEMVRLYRDYYGLFSASAILFNHESPLRSAEFVTRKVSLAAARIKLGLQDSLSLGDLSARRDWGFAGDYVKACWMILQQEQAQDFVIASGATHSVEDLCEVAFSRLDLDYRSFVTAAPQSLRPVETAVLVGDAQRASDIGWAPQVDFRSLVTMMVDADYERERKSVRMDSRK